MATLTGATPAATYKSLLKIEGTNQEIDGTLRTVEDGNGGDTPLQLASDKVQINTTDDTSVKISATTSHCYLYLTTVTEADKNMAVNFQDHSAIKGAVGWDDGEAALKLVTGTALGGTEGITVKAGKVGIGIVAPATDLDVASNTPTITLTDLNATNNAYCTVGAGTGSLIFKADVDADIASETMQWWMSGSQKMTLLATGNLGIGTTNPDGLLHLRSSAEGGIADGSTNVAQLLIESTGSTGGTTGPTLALLNSSTGENEDIIGVLAFLGDSATADADGDASASTTYARMYGRIKEQADGAEIGALYFQTPVSGTLATHLYMAEEKIGVNTAAPSAALHVDQKSASGARPVLKLDQADTDDSFIDFIGTTNTDGSNSIHLDTTEDNAKFGAIKIEINGSTKWIRVYDGGS